MNHTFAVIDTNGNDWSGHLSHCFGSMNVTLLLLQ